MTANDPEACSLKRIAAGEDQREGWYYAVNDYDAQVSMDAHLAKLKLIVIDAFHLETLPPKFVYTWKCLSAVVIMFKTVDTRWNGSAV